jgi:hypothetical protein
MNCRKLSVSTIKRSGVELSSCNSCSLIVINSSYGLDIF